MYFVQPFSLGGSSTELLTELLLTAWPHGAVWGRQVLGVWGELEKRDERVNSVCVRCGVGASETRTFPSYFFFLFLFSRLCAVVLSRVDV